MKVVVPVLDDTCQHVDEERLRFRIEPDGRVQMLCVEHGEIPKFKKLEFESKEAYEEWRRNERR